MKATKPEYKSTLFDRYGPDMGSRLRAYIYGFMVFGLTIAGAILVVGQGGVAVSLIRFVLLLAAAVFAGALVTGFSMLLSGAAGATYTHLMVSGSTTPYKEQYSYQQSLVMQGKVDEALESFEAVIAEKPDAVDPRVKAAELYARQAGNPARAAELFREIQRIPSITVGDDIYATNRLADLLTGPLSDSGRALVELRRLIEKYPSTAAAEHARDAIANLKPAHLRSSTSVKANEGDG